MLKETYVVLQIEPELSVCKQNALTPILYLFSLMISIEIVFAKNVNSPFEQYVYLYYIILKNS